MGVAALKGVINLDSFDVATCGSTTSDLDDVLFSQGNFDCA